MFYQDAIGAKVRFGDVLRGFLSTIPTLTRPFVEEKVEPYTIDIATTLSVVVDPCCSIGEGVISLTPLIQVKPHYWDTPHLTEDMTEINRLVKPKDLMHPEVWNRRSIDDKTQFLNAAKGYGLKNYFAYEGNPIFTEYSVTRKSRFEEIIDLETQLPKYVTTPEVNTFKTRYYMIDFKNIRTVNCKKIVDSEKPTDDDVLGSIVLQLSEKTREELRNKMGYYFERPPDREVS